MVYHHPQRLANRPHFEVDSTESVWYNLVEQGVDGGHILKLTPQSQYGIGSRRPRASGTLF